MYYLIQYIHRTFKLYLYNCNDRLYLILPTVSLHATKLIKQTLEEIESSIEKYAPFRGTL